MSANPAENLGPAISVIREAAARKAHIVCLPELFRSPYFCVTEKSPVDYAETVPGEVGTLLCKEAKALNISIVTGSVYEKTPSGDLFNTAMVINAKGELCGTYRKVHIPHAVSYTPLTLPPNREV